MAEIAQKKAPSFVGTLFKFCASTLMSCVLLLIALEVLLGLTFQVKDKFFTEKGPNAYESVAPKPKEFLSEAKLFYTSGEPVPSKTRSGYQHFWTDFHAYETADEKFVATVLDDFFNFEKLGLDYTPWSQFHSPVFDGELVHVDLYKDRYPVRRTMNPQTISQAKNSDLLVFTFGGSTTFGFNVADQHTWPSFLAAELSDAMKRNGSLQNVTVINFGFTYYDPSQEVMLMINLLRDGERPDIVLFMDGINGTGVSPGFLSRDLFKTTRRIQHSERMRNLEELLSGSSTMRLVSFLQHKIFKIKSSDDETATRFEEIPHSYAENMEIARKVCSIYGCAVYSFIQPAVTLNYNLDLFRAPLTEEDIQNLIETDKTVYEKMLKYTESVDLTHLYEIWGKNRKVFIDDCHYSPGFNKLIAQQVAKTINSSGHSERSPTISSAENSD